MQGTFKPAGFALSLIHKDLSAALATARELGVPLFQGALGRRLFAQTLGPGYDVADFTAVSRVHEQGLGIRIADGRSPIAPVTEEPRP